MANPIKVVFFHDDSPRGVELNNTIQNLFMSGYPNLNWVFGFSNNSPESMPAKRQFSVNHIPTILFLGKDLENEVHYPLEKVQGYLSADEIRERIDHWADQDLKLKQGSGGTDGWIKVTNKPGGQSLGIPLFGFGLGNIPKGVWLLAAVFGGYKFATACRPMCKVVFGSLTAVSAVNYFKK